MTARPKVEPDRDDVDSPLPAKTTDPQPKKTSTNVPSASAETFWTVVEVSAMAAA